MRILLLVALFVAHSILTNAQTITYVGNMGVLISGDSTSILIDGLHKEYKPAYQYPPKSLVDELIGTEKAYQPPIRYILNTHIHKDHFDAELIVEFMQHNAKTVLFSRALV